jgi:ankyrin repeat protein
MASVRSWSSASEVLRYLAENWPFEPDWPDGTHEIDVNDTMGDGDSPLHFACRWGDSLAVELLIRAGAAIDCAGDMGVTPLGVAVGSGHAEIAALLLRSGASPHVRSEFGTTPFEEAMNATPDLRAVFAA